MQLSFIDPRFKSLQEDDDVADIKCALKKLNDIDPDTSDITTVKKEKEHPSPSALNKQKSGKGFSHQNKRHRRINREIVFQTFSWPEIFLRQQGTKSHTEQKHRSLRHGIQQLQSERGCKPGSTGIVVVEGVGVIVSEFEENCQSFQLRAVKCTEM